MALGFLVTRPGTDGIDLVEKLKSNSILAFHLPAYDLVNIKYSSPLNISEEDELFFFSKRAVISAADNWTHLFENGINNRCWAVGPSTGDVLRRKGASRVRVTRRGVYDSYSLIADLEQEVISLKSRCILFQQEKGLRVVADYLEERGLLVDRINIYKQDLLSYEKDTWDKLTDYHAIIFTSGASIEEFSRRKENVYGKIAFVVGSRLFNIASSLNIFSKVVQLPSANNLEILEAVRKYKDVYCEQRERKYR